MPYLPFERGEWQLSGRQLMETNVRLWAVCRPPYGFRGRTKQAFGAVCIITHPAAGNEVHDTDNPRRLRIRARHSWNPAVTDVVVNTRSHIGVLGPRHTARSRWRGIRVHFERNTHLRRRDQK